MKLYAVSKFYFGDRSPELTQYKLAQMLYLGTDRHEAIRIANSVAPPTFTPPDMRFPALLCALPTTVEREVIRYHNRDHIWASVVEFNIEGDTNDAA